MPFTDPALTLAAHDMAVGTVVLTLEGAIPVEFLNPGDRIITRNGACRLLGVQSLQPIPFVRLRFDQPVEVYLARSSEIAPVKRAA